MTLVEQAQRLLSELEDIQRRMTTPVDDFEAYNDYYQDRIEDMIIKAQRRLERRSVSLPSGAVRGDTGDDPSTVQPPSTQS